MTGEGGLSVASARKRKGGGRPTCILLRLRRDTELLSQRVLVSPGDLSLQRAQLANATDLRDNGLARYLHSCRTPPPPPVPLLRSADRFLQRGLGIIQTAEETRISAFLPRFRLI